MAICAVFFVYLCQAVSVLPFYLIWGFLLPFLIFPCAFLLRAGAAWSVFAVVGRNRVSVVRLVSKSIARLRGVCMWGKERRVGVLRRVGCFALGGLLGGGCDAREWRGISLGLFIGYLRAVVPRLERIRWDSMGLGGARWDSMGEWGGAVWLGGLGCIILRLALCQRFFV